MKLRRVKDFISPSFVERRAIVVLTNRPANLDQLGLFLEAYAFPSLFDRLANSPFKLGI
jgi:hypothetical protein